MKTETTSSKIIKIIKISLLLINSALCSTGNAQVPVANFSISQNPVCAGVSVSITDLSTDSPTSWSYTLSGGTPAISSVQDPTVTYTSAGVYSISLEAINGNGSSTPFTQTISVDPLPVLTVSGSTSTCLGSVFTQTASGADTYSWSFGATTNTIAFTVTSNTTYVLAGTYTLTGCIDSINVSITASALPTIGVNSGSVCAGDVFTIIPSGAQSYSFSGGSGTVSPNVTTSYSVMGMDASGCISSQPAIANITVYQLPVITANSGSICTGSLFTIMPAGALTYTISSGNSFTVSPPSNTTYSISGTDAQGCVSQLPAISNITVYSLPAITVNSGTICQGDNFVIAPTGAATYTVLGGSFTVSPSSATSYSVIGSSAQGCSSSSFAIANVMVNSLPAVLASSNSSITCAGSAAILTASGALTYTWDGSQTGQVIMVSPTVTTTYTVMGTDANGCMNFAVVVQSVDNCSGLRDVVGDVALSIYPNPVKDELVLIASRDMSLILHDALGRQVNKIEAVKGSNIMLLGNLAPGIYFIVVPQANTVKTLRIIKN